LVREKRHLAPLYTKKQSFYQDRLGTNAGKTQKSGVFLRAAAALLGGGAVPTCSGEAGFAVQAAIDAAKISAREGRQVAVETLD